MKASSKKVLLRTLYIIIFAAAIIVLAGGAFYFAYHDRIYPKTYAAGLNFGGKTKVQAAQMLADKVEALPVNLEVNLSGGTSGSQNGNIALQAFAPQFKTDAAADSMFALGRSGNLINKISDAVHSFFTKKELALNVQIDPKNLQNGYIAIEDRFGLHPVQNAQYALDQNGQVFVQAEHSGFGFPTEQLSEELSTKLSNFSTTLNLHAQDLQPETKTSDLTPKLSLAATIISRLPLNLTAASQKSVIDKTVALSFLGNSNVSIGNSDQQIFNGQVLKDFLNGIGEKINTEAHNVTIQKSADGSWQVNGDITNGTKLKVDDSAQAIETKLLATDTKAGSTIDLPVDTVAAQVQGDEANSLGIKELIGIGVTDFKGSPPNRVHNVTVGAKAFNNALIPPNSEFSAIKTLGPVNKASGYLPELVIKEDSTVPEYGGGLCQVSTTLFRASLDAGLKITARQNHSYRVPYYEPPIGLDATIYEPAPDFRFMNDTPGYILVATKVEGTTLTFYLFGTKDGRSSAISTPVVSNVTAPPPPKYTLTTTLAPGVTKRLDTQHYGATAVVHYTVTRDGAVINNQTFTSHYQAWQAKYLVGAPAGSVAGPDGIVQVPGATPAPTPSPVPTSPVY